jgi:DNA-binding helix-hairpin-helix protein with protein kinase domain
VIAPLVSFGIETAADVTRLQYQPVPGFGPKRIQQLLKWRDDLLKKFVFRPGQAIAAADLAALQAKFASRMSPLEAQLRTGPASLERIVKEAHQQFDQLRVKLDALYRDAAGIEQELRFLNALTA